MDVQLIEPNLDYKAAFAIFYNDFWTNDPVNAGFYVDGIRDFDAYVDSLYKDEQGIDLLDGHVPCSHCWMIDSDGNVLGVIRIRHNIEPQFLREEAGHIGYDMAPSYRKRGLGTRMLALGLQRATALGLKKVMISADEDNYGSRKIIEANGGILEAVIQGKVYECPIARYWIDL